MHRIRQRVDALERGRAEGFKAYHCIRRYEGQTEAEAMALYEDEHGPIDIESENLLYVVIRKPFPSLVAT